jgi:hypothetical protein
MSRSYASSPLTTLMACSGTTLLYVFTNITALADVQFTCTQTKDLQILYTSVISNVPLLKVRRVAQSV